MAEQDLVEVVIDGETQKLPRETIEKIRQGDNWTRELTHRAESLSARERTLNTREQTLAERESTIERRQQQEPERNVRGESAVQEAGINIADLPSPLDDPEAYNKAIGRKLKEAADLGYQRAAGEFKKQVDTVRKEAVANDSRQAAQTIDLQRNKDTIQAFAERRKEEGRPLTPEQRQKLVQHMDTQLRLPAQGYGERSRSGVFVFTETALEAADYATRPNYWKNVWKEEGLREGLGKNPDGANLRPRTPSPKKEAGSDEKVKYALSLPPESRALQEYVDSMSDAELNQFIIAQHNAYERELTVGQI